MCEPKGGYVPGLMHNPNIFLSMHTRLPSWIDTRGDSGNPWCLFRCQDTPLIRGSLPSLSQLGGRRSPSKRPSLTECLSFSAAWGPQQSHAAHGCFTGSTIPGSGPAHDFVECKFTILRIQRQVLFSSVKIHVSNFNFLASKFVAFDLMLLLSTFLCQISPDFMFPVSFSAPQIFFVMASNLRCTKL